MAHLMVGFVIFNLTLLIDLQHSFFLFVIMIPAGSFWVSHGGSFVC